MIACKICSKRFSSITNTHLTTHNTSIKKYNQKFHTNIRAFALNISDLSKSDSRYKMWRESLKNRPIPNEKEYLKRGEKISKTFRKKHIDNFKVWREEMIRVGKIKIYNTPFPPSKELAFLIGLALGDGNIGAFPRTERLAISLNTKYPKLVNYTKFLLKKFFEKTPSTHTVGNGIRIWVYQKNISKRLKVPTGNREGIKIKLPKWIKESDDYLLAWVKGLFEAEGSLSIHLPTCTYNFQFRNKNPHLLKEIGRALERFGFHPEYRKEHSTRLRRKKEVAEFKKLIHFRIYR